MLPAFSSLLFLFLVFLPSFSHLIPSFLIVLSAELLSTLPSPAISLTEGDYVEVLMWATLLEISSICQHAAISIPDADKCLNDYFAYVKSNLGMIIVHISGSLTV